MHGVARQKYVQLFQFRVPYSIVEGKATHLTHFSAAAAARLTAPDDGF